MRLPSLFGCWGTEASMSCGLDSLLKSVFREAGRYSSTLSPSSERPNVNASSRPDAPDLEASIPSR